MISDHWALPTGVGCDDFRPRSLPADQHVKEIRQVRQRAAGHGLYRLPAPWGAGGFRWAVCEAREGGTGAAALQRPRHPRQKEAFTPVRSGYDEIIQS